jgi:hypothetical protein
VKPGLDLIGHIPARHPAPAAPAASAQPSELDTAKIAQIVGHEGEKFGLVYKITVGRDDIDLREMGAKINARMGLNTWASFVGTKDHAAIAGDVAMLENRGAAGPGRRYGRTARGCGDPSPHDRLKADHNFSHLGGRPASS